jgi:regulator of protease activity HflC (stomatin/prohibitin superfamily)
MFQILGPGGYVGIVIGVIVFIFLCCLLGGVKVVLEYERLIIFRLGRYRRTVGPGLVYVLPGLEKARKVDLRIVTADIPRQEIITRDNIPVLANTVVYYKVQRPADAINKIENYAFAVRQYTQAALRDVVGNMELDGVLTEREKVAKDIKEIVDSETDSWGIDISAIKIQEIPAEMKRAMAKQAEAERDKRAVIIASEGELQAAENLRKAAEILAGGAGLQLRTLQTIRDISQDPSEKLVIFMPTSFEETVKKMLK